MLKDIEGNEEYAEAVTNTFIECIKAPGMSLHSKSVPLFGVLVQAVHEKG